MSRSISKAGAVDDQLATPHAVNTEVANYLGAFNGGLDHNNVPNDIITGDKFALDTFHQIVKEETVTTRTTTHDATHSKGDWEPIPDDAGNPWEILIDTEDGELEIILSAGIYMASTVNRRIVVGIFVDGAIAAHSGLSGYHNYISYRVDAMWPIRAGRHVVSFRYSLHDKPSAAVNYNWLGRSAWVREIRR